MTEESESTVDEVEADEETPRRRASDKDLAYLAENVTTLSQSSLDLLEEVRASNETIQRDRLLQRQMERMLRKIKKLLVFAVVAAVAAVVIAGGVVLIGINIADGAADIKDCTTPQGLCARSGAARTAGVILDVEVKRNVTEIGLAQLRGDVVAADYRQNVVNELSEDVTALNRYADAIRRGENAQPPVLHKSSIVTLQQQPPVR